MGLPLNLVSLVIFVAKLQHHPVDMDTFLLNLTLSDLLLLPFLLFYMVEAANGMCWPLTFIFFPFSGFLFFTTIYLTSIFLEAVSIVCFLSVAYLLCYKTWPSGACQLLAAELCSMVYITEFLSNSSRSQGTKGTCYLEFQEDQLAILLAVQLKLTVVLFGVTQSSITSYCYTTWCACSIREPAIAIRRQWKD